MHHAASRNSVLLPRNALLGTQWRPAPCRCAKTRLRWVSLRVTADGGVFDRLEKLRRELKQRWRATRFAAIEGAQDAKKQIMANPIAFRVVRFLMFLQQLAQPFVAFWKVLDKRLDEFLRGYADFCVEETKRVFVFKNRFEKEIEFWSDGVRFSYVLLYAMLYQAWAPFAIFRAAILPLYIGYACYERLLTNPLALSVAIKAAVMVYLHRTPCLL